MSKYIFIVIFTIFALSSCNQSADNDNRPKLSVTIEPLRYFVDQISDNEYNVNVIVPSGASPESYEPSISAMRRFEDSKLFISIGLLDCERSIDQYSSSSERNRVVLKDCVALLEGSCSHDHDHDHDNGHDSGHYHHHHSHFDPHIWSSVANSKIIAEIITQNLTKLEPTKSEKYHKNLNDLISRIDSLDNYIKARLLTKKEPYFVIFHPALTYFAKEYGMEQISLEEDGKEASIEQLKSIISDHGEIKGVFYQSEFSKNSVESIARELNIESVEIDPLAYNWLENMYEITNKLDRYTN